MYEHVFKPVISCSRRDHKNFAEVYIAHNHTVKFVTLAAVSYQTTMKYINTVSEKMDISIPYQKIIDTLT